MSWAFYIFDCFLVVPEFKWNHYHMYPMHTDILHRNLLKVSIIDFVNFYVGD